MKRGLVTLVLTALMGCASLGQQNSFSQSRFHEGFRVEYQREQCRSSGSLLRYVSANNKERKIETRYKVVCEKEAVEKEYRLIAVDSLLDGTIDHIYVSLTSKPLSHETIVYRNERGYKFKGCMTDAAEQEKIEIFSLPPVFAFFQSVLEEKKYSDIDYRRMHEIVQATISAGDGIIERDKGCIKKPVPTIYL